MIVSEFIPTFFLYFLSDVIFTSEELMYRKLFDTKFSFPFFLYE